VACEHFHQVLLLDLHLQSSAVEPLKVLRSFRNRRNRCDHLDPAREGLGQPGGNQLNLPVSVDELVYPFDHQDESVVNGLRVDSVFHQLQVQPIAADLEPVLEVGPYFLLNELHLLVDVQELLANR